MNEDLRKWFKEKWVRMDTKGNIKGDCAREEGEGKPKCLPSFKAYSMSKKDRASAARRKRREDPVADRPGKGGKPINVRTMEEQMDIFEGNKPTNPELWSRAKALARSKFDVYPSAYANGWAAKWYKSKGGGWKSVSEGTDDEGGMAKGELQTIASKAKELAKMMKKNKQLDAWVQSKITKADDYVGSVHDFLKNGRQEVDESRVSFRDFLEETSCCEECTDDAFYGSVEEDFDPTGNEQYEDWGDDETIHISTVMEKYLPILNNIQETVFSYNPFKSTSSTSKGHTVVGITKDEQGRKGANILKHKSGGYFAAPGSLTRQEGDIHNTPEAAAKAFHAKRKENLAEADTPLSFILKNPGKKLPMHLDPNRPFDPDMPKKNPVAKAGKYGQGFSIANHLAKQGMASVKEDETYEAANLAQQAAIAIAMKKAGKKPKNVDEAKYQKLTPRQKFTNSLARAGYDVNASSKRIQDLLDKQKNEREEKQKKDMAEGAKWRNHPDAYNVDDEGNKTPRNPNSPKFGYDPLQRRADTANDAKTSRGKTAALKTSLKMAQGNKGVAEGWGFDKWGHDTWTDAQKEVARKKKNEKQRAQRQQNKDQQNKDQQKSREQGVAEGNSVAKYKVKSIGKDSKGDYYMSPSTGKKVYKSGVNKGDHENPKTGEIKNRVAEGIELQEAEKNGKKVQLNKPFRTSDGKGKFAVYTKNEKGNVVKVNFGDTTGLTIKTSNPDRRRNFRARHNCDNPGPKHKARYWSCRAWSRDTVSAGLGT